MNQGTAASRGTIWRYFRFALFSIALVTIIFLQSYSLQGLNPTQDGNRPSWSNTAVTFPNNTSAQILNLAETQIDTAVPAGAINGNVFVTTDTGTSNNVSFELGSSFIPDATGEAETWQSTFSGTIATDTTWNTDLLLTGDVTVPAGVTLTIEAGTTIFGSSTGDDQANGRWTDKTELIVFGTLLVNGTEAEPVYFTSDAATKAAGDWGGIQIREGSTTSELSTCMIRHATEGVGISSQDIPGGGDVWANVHNCAIQQNQIGITIRANTNWPNGIHINVGGEIQNNAITDNVAEGIFLWIWCGYQSALTNPIITNNVIQNNGSGIYLRAGSWWLGHVDERTIIKNNNISNNATHGILVEAMGSSDSSGSDTDAKPIIENNLLRDNETNIYLNLIPQGADGLQDFQPVIQYNTISDAFIGIVVAETEPYDTYNPIINHNVFEKFNGTNSYAISNQSSRIVYANDSYWGSTPAEWDAGEPSDALFGSTFSASNMDSSSAPLITMISPRTGQPGDSVTLYGANLGSVPQVYLPAVLNKVASGIAPIFIGNAIPQRDVQAVREIFYSTAIQIPQELPSSGNFYLSAQSNTISPVLVDDEIIFKMNDSVIYTHDFSAGGIPHSATLIIPRPLMEQVRGKEVTVEYRDVYGDIVTASEMWLIWVP